MRSSSHVLLKSECDSHDAGNSISAHDDDDDGVTKEAANIGSSAQPDQPPILLKVVESLVLSYPAMITLAVP